MQQQALLLAGALQQQYQAWLLAQAQEQQPQLQQPWPARQHDSLLALLPTGAGETLQAQQQHQQQETNNGAAAAAATGGGAGVSRGRGW